MAMAHRLGTPAVDYGNACVDTMMLTIATIMILRINHNMGHENKRFERTTKITTTALGIMVLNSNIIINSFVKLVIIIINLIIIFCYSSYYDYQGYDNGCFY